MKYKGTARGIELAVTTVLRLEGNTESPEVFVVNKDYEGNLIYTIYICTSSKSIEAKTALREILKYIVPTGYLIDISFAQSWGAESTDNFTITQSLSGMIQNTGLISSVLNPATLSSSEQMYKDYVSTFAISEVINPNTLKLDGNNEFDTSHAQYFDEE